MAFLNFKTLFQLYTDALHHGLCAVLNQEQEGRMRVIGFGSSTLTAGGQNYHLHPRKLEFLALTEQFRYYLYYEPQIMVLKHNNPLI